MPRRSRSRSPISSSSRRRSSRRSPSPSPPRKHSSASRMRSDQIGEKSALQRIQVSGGEGGGGARSGVSTHKDKEKKVPKEIRQLQDRVRKDLLEDDGDVERKFLALGSLTRSEQGYIFKGAEFEDVSPKELRKIQIDIRRSIPAHRISNSTIKRRITDPADVVMPRNKSEGVRPVFSRDDIFIWLPDREDGSPNLSSLVHSTRSTSPTVPPRSGGHSSRHRSPSSRRQSLAETTSFRNNHNHSQRDDRNQRRSSRSRSRSPFSARLEKKDLKSRLGGRETDINRREVNDARSRIDRMGEQQQEAERDWRGRGAGGGKSDSIRDRLGGKMRGRPDPNRPLDREELESQRPGTKPWDLNPEIVPRGKYFEHDSREDDHEGNFNNRGFHRGGQGGFRGRGMHFRGRGRSNWHRGRGGYDNHRDPRDGGSENRWQQRKPYRRQASPEWKHDLFEKHSKDEEPTSTTND